MQSGTPEVWQSPLPKQLSQLLATISNVKDMQNLLGDVMTEKEIIEIAARLEAARMLLDGARYTDVIAKTKLSSRTVARISSWLENGYGGYKTALTIHHHASSKPRLRAA